MKIVVMADVHANLPALKAALTSITQRGYDLCVHTGDAIGIGPFPAECMDLLLSLPQARFVMGNHDALYAHGLPTPRPKGVGDGEVVHQRWTHDQLGADLRPRVAEWPYHIEQSIGGLKLSFLHYPQDQNGDFARIIKEPTVEQLDQLFSKVPGDLIFYGHHHPYADVSTGTRRYVNPGSLGCAPFAIARYCVVEVQNGGYQLTHHSVPYDDAPLVEAFEKRRVPERHMIAQSFFYGRFNLTSN